jgi:N-methylhydantoinase A
LEIGIGGNFTDPTLIDEATGEIRIGKVPLTPRDQSLGFLEATHRMLRQADVSPAEVGYVVHGTTVATNGTIEGKMARTGFITTEGFCYMLEIARRLRPPISIYDLLFEKPRPVVSHHLSFGGPVTQRFADEIGADFYSSDAEGAVTITADFFRFFMQNS